MAKSGGHKIITRNRKASHEYHLTTTYQAGLVLMGSEIKSIRLNQVNLSDGFVQERDGELWLMNVHVAPYAQAKAFGHTDPRRPRKLLLHKKEIAQIISRIREKGMSAIPITLYLDGGRAKVEVAIGQGKKLYDKRASIAERDTRRELQRIMKER